MTSPYFAQLLGLKVTTRLKSALPHDVMDVAGTSDISYELAVIDTSLQGLALLTLPPWTATCRCM